MMKLKATIFALFLAVMAASSAFAAIRHVDAAGSNTFLIDHDGAGPQLIGDPNTCLILGAPCLTIAYAHSVADQWDTILLAAGAYTESGVDITKDYITVSGPIALGPAPGARTACDASEACITGTGLVVAIF